MFLMVRHAPLPKGIKTNGDAHIQPNLGVWHAPLPKGIKIPARCTRAACLHVRHAPLPKGIKKDQPYASGLKCRIRHQFTEFN